MQERRSVHLVLLIKVSLLNRLEGVLDAALLIVRVLCTLELEHLGLPQHRPDQVRVQGIIIALLKVLQYMPFVTRSRPPQRPAYEDIMQ